MNIEQRFISAGVLLIITLIFGFWLSHSGKPYNMTLFTIHKVVALVMVVIGVTILFSLLKHVEIPMSIILLVSVAGVSVVVTFATGVLMSIGNVSLALARIVHIISTVFLVVSSGLSILLSIKLGN